MTQPIKSYEALQKAYDIFNHELFQGKLDNCLITLQRQPHTYGYISYNRFSNNDNAEIYTHELALNPEYFGIVPLVKILEIMVHEMVHLWQFQYGNPSQKAYHNKEWADKMESIGLMPSNTGRVGGKRTGQKMDDYPIKGGLFLKVAEKIMMDNLTIQWYDRVIPNFTPARSIYHQQQITEAVGKKNRLSFVPILDTLNSPLTKFNVNKEQLRSLIERFERERAGITEDNEDDDISSLPVPESVLEFIRKDQKKPIQQKKGKVKFSCPECGNNAWGKESLNIICGDCDVHFIMND